MKRALQGLEYSVSDIIATDVCLGYHPITGAQPTAENIEHGFNLNMMFIDLLIKHDFSVIVICIGMALRARNYTRYSSCGRISS